jgi:hypothetical protein
MKKNIPTTTKKAKSHDRAAGSTNISVSMSEDLRNKIRLAAEKDRRSVSQWIAINIEKVLGNDATF